MAYLWTTTAKIQTYLDSQSVITIGEAGTFSESDAMTLENDIVYDIVSYLLPSFVISETTVSPLLAGITAKLTAAQIGQTRFANSMDSEPPAWTYRFKNEAWGSLYRVAINQSLPGVSPKTISVEDRLIYAKLRERSVVASV